MEDIACQQVSCFFYPLCIFGLNSCWFLRFAYGVLRRFLPDEKVEQLKGLALTADGKGAVFDVPAEDVDLFIAGIFFY